jgi:hypothetical protein
LIVLTVVAFEVGLRARERDLQPPPISDFDATLDFIVNDSLHGGVYAKSRSLDAWVLDGIADPPDARAVLVVGLWGSSDLLDEALGLIEEHAKETERLSASSVRYLMRMLDVSIELKEGQRLLMPPSQSATARFNALLGVWSERDEFIPALFTIIESGLWANVARARCLYELGYAIQRPQGSKLTDGQINSLIDLLIREDTRQGAFFVMDGYRGLKEHTDALERIRRLAKGPDCNLVSRAAILLDDVDDFDPEVFRGVNECAENADAEVRRETVGVYYRVFASHLEPPSNRLREALNMLQKLANDPSAAVRRDAEDALYSYKQLNSLRQKQNGR